VQYALQCCREDDFILTLNNDTVLPADYLETMISLSQSASKALIGSIARDYHQRDRIIDAGVRIHWASAKFNKIKNPQAQGTSFYAVSALPGRGTLIPVGVFHEIGLFDHRYFPQYAADYDFSLRAGKAGYDLLLHPECYLYSKTQLTGISNIHNKLGFGAWLKSFNSVKSPNNLTIRFKFAIRHVPAIWRPSFIICDFLRVTFGTLRNQITNLI
jgi:GT2 family glycosyltransferase